MGAGKWCITFCVKMKKHAEISIYFCLKHQCGKKSAILPYTLAHKHQFKILLKERCEIDYLHRLVLTSMWSEKLHHKSAKKSIKLW